MALEILDLFNIESSNEDILRLPNLRALSIRLRGSNGLLIVSQNLHSLRMNAINDLIKFEHPLTVKYLKSNRYWGNIIKFINLEELQLDTCKDLNPNIVTKFNNLKKLKINNCENGINELKNIFRFKNADLELILDGVKIKKISKFNECNDWLKFQLENYNDLEDNLDYIKIINYSSMILLSNNRLPPNLFRKYSNIQCLSINRKTEDESLLIEFIKNLNNLYRLDINDKNLVSQNFYNKLPIVSNLVNITTCDFTIDFEFLIKMSFLKRLYVEIDGRNTFIIKKN